MKPVILHTFNSPKGYTLTICKTYSSGYSYLIAYHKGFRRYLNGITSAEDAVTQGMTELYKLESLEPIKIGG